MTIRRDLRASRNLGFATTLELEYSGGELPLGTISMQVRLYPGQPGAALASIASVGFNDNPHESIEGMRVLEISPGISKETLAGFPTGLNKPEVGEADVFAYEIKAVYADGQADALWIGRFILEPGVNIA